MVHACHAPGAHEILPGLDTRIPEVGEAILYRHDCDGEPVAAHVIAVDTDPGDLNVWARPGVLAADPNPDVTVQLDGAQPPEGRWMTRQIRRAGSPGWCRPGAPS